MHSHAQSVLPFNISDVAFEPTYHLTGFLGESVPVFDIADYYLRNDSQNMLISDIRFGSALADMFSTNAHNRRPTTRSARTSSGATINVTKNNTQPDSTVVLQRGHGFAIVAKSVEQAAYGAVLTIYHAEVQASAIEVKEVVGKNPSSLKDQSAREAADCVVVNNAGLAKEWPLWVAQTLVDPLYKNELD